jgi:hypothetical protein
VIDFDGPSKDPTEHLDELEDRFQQERDRALEEAKEQAKRVVPVDTGALRRSIEIRGNSVVTDKDYAPRINFGFTGTDSLGRTYDYRGTFFLSDAAKDSFIDSVERLRNG